MRLPALAIAAAFAGGILLGLWNPWHAVEWAVPFLIGVFLLSLALILVAFAMALRGWVAAAACASLLCWGVLGVCAAGISDEPLPREHVLSRIADSAIALHTPLRWHGTLRNDPERLPWGYGMDLELNGVETAGGFLPVRGGLRLGFTPKGEDALPAARAGDEVVVFAQAKLPAMYRDAGAFDRRAFLAEQGVHLQATLRSAKLLEVVGTPERLSLGTQLARARTRLRTAIYGMFAGNLRVAGILRAMLLGDRSFVDRAESVDFQKTGTYHVLAVAGLHVGALAFFLIWATRRLRLPRTWATVVLLVALAGYVAIVEARAPVLRAGLMAGVVVLAGFFYRRMELLNSAAIAAMILLVARPRFVLDTGFQLSFLAVACIGGLALPWIEARIEPYAKALRHWRDVSRDRAFVPVMAQFRLDVRDGMRFVGGLFPSAMRSRAQDGFGWGLRGGLRVAALLVISTVLQIGMLPLMAREFHRVSLLGPAANLVVVPLVGLIVPLGFLSLAGAMVSAALGHLLAQPLLWLVNLQNSAVAFFAKLPHGDYRIPGPPIWLIVGFLVALAVVACAFRGTRGAARWVLRSSCVAALAGAVAIATFPFHPRVATGSLEVSVLDVGQGDSILVVSPRGSTLLIDGGGAFQGFSGHEEHLGPDPGEEAVSAYLWSRGIKRLDAVALTHAHQDHIGGLAAVLENFRVSRLILGRETAAPAMKRLEELAARQHVPMEHEIRGQRFLWDGVRVEVLWPEISPDEVAPAAKNNDSLVLRLTYGERSVLLPGDAEKQVEYAMLRENGAAALHADVLKVGHHGSKNSTMPEFLSAIAPQVAVISDGAENPYGHPSPVLLERLRGSDARILRTDEHGAVRILTDGHTLQVSCFVECEETGAQSSRVHAPDNHEKDQQ